MDCNPPGSSVHVILQAIKIAVGCHFLLQGIFQTQESNLGLLHCKQMIYWLSYEVSSGASDASRIIYTELWFGVGDWEQAILTWFLG